MGKLLAEIIIPKMFDAIQAPVALDGSPYNDGNVYAHYCTECEQAFTARWGYTSGCGWQIWDGNKFKCPKCGTISTYKGSTRDIGAGVPSKMTLRLYEYTNHVSLRVTYTAVVFDDVNFSYFKTPCRETITFDVAKRRAYFEDTNAVKCEISNPAETEFSKNSVLRFLRHNSIAWKTNKKEFANLLLKLRKVITRKTKALFGTKLEAMHAPAGHKLGTLIFPLCNVAWRLAVPDAPNLPAAFNDPSWRSDYSGFLDSYYIKKSELEGFFDKIIDSSRAGKSYPQSALDARGIKDTKAFRKIIAKGCVLEAGRIEAAILISADYKEQLLVQKALSYTQHTTTCGIQIEELRAQPAPNLKFLRMVSDSYKNNAAYFMLKNYDVHTIGDCVRTYSKLASDVQELLWAEQPPIPQIHDWLVFKWQEQKNKDFSLAVPEHVVKRLAMQKDRLKFFLPETAHELKSIGQKLHNCVGTYADRVLAGRCAIVAMTDDEGKLLVCIEVTDGAIRQAKLNQNQPVSANTELNAAVLDWAKKAKLKVATTDIATANKDNKELRNAI